MAASAPYVGFIANTEKHMTQRERKLLKIVMAPTMKGLLPLPTFEEWCAAFDELFPDEAKPQITGHA
jgi:hypothetical protein